jgi:hypothetical protein
MVTVQFHTNTLNTITLESSMSHKKRPVTWTGQMVQRMSSRFKLRQMVERGCRG